MGTAYYLSPLNHQTLKENGNTGLDVRCRKIGYHTNSNFFWEIEFKDFINGCRHVSEDEYVAWSQTANRGEIFPAYTQTSTINHLV